MMRATYTHNPYAMITQPLMTDCRCESCYPSQQHLSHNHNHHHHVPHHAPAAFVAPTDATTTTTSPDAPLWEIAKTSRGSTYIQSILTSTTTEDEQKTSIYNEILPYATDLLMDTHGCYVIKKIMELLPVMDVENLLTHWASKTPQLFYQLCTSTLHSRRIVQFWLDIAPTTTIQLMSPIAVKYCLEISSTQHGCIVMQRILNGTDESHKDQIFAVVRRNFARFAMDPFANYVCQYMFDNSTQSENEHTMQSFVLGNMLLLSRDKYASNVVEKALQVVCRGGHSTALTQALIDELFSLTASHDALSNLLQDSYSNYIVQAMISLCGMKDVVTIAERLRPVLHLTPYGNKIAAKLEKRLRSGR